MSGSQLPPTTTSPLIPGGPTPEKSTNGLAITGFVLGLLGLLMSWIPLLNVLGILLGVLGLIFAGIGWASSKKSGAGKGLAIAGLVMSVLAIVVAILVNAVFVDAVDSALDDATSNSVEESSQEERASGSDSGDAEAGTTRADPVPLGSAITGGDWTVVVNSVKSIDSDSLGSRAKSGSVLLLVNIKATYNGDDEQGSTPWSTVKYVAPDGTTVDSTNGSTLFLAENEFDSLTTVYEGAVVTGDQILEVPAEGWQNGVLALSPDLLSDDTFVALR